MESPSSPQAKKMPRDTGDALKKRKQWWQDAGSGDDAPKKRKKEASTAESSSDAVAVLLGLSSVDVELDDALPSPSTVGTDTEEDCPHGTSKDYVKLPHSPMRVQWEFHGGGGWWRGCGSQDHLERAFLQWLKNGCPHRYIYLLVAWGTAARGFGDVQLLLP